MPAELELVDAAIDRISERPEEGPEQDTTETDLEEATAAPLDAGESECGGSDEEVRTIVRYKQLLYYIS